MFFYGPVQRHHRALHIFRNLPGNGLVRVTRHHHRALRLCRYLRGNHIMALKLHRTRGMLPKKSTSPVHDTAAKAGPVEPQVSHAKKGYSCASRTETPSPTLSMLSRQYGTGIQRKPYATQNRARPPYGDERLCATSVPPCIRKESRSSTARVPV